MSLFANVALPFGIYTAVTYISINKMVFNIVFACSGVLSFICSGIIICRKIRNKKKAKYIIVNRIRQAISRTQFFFAMGLTCAMIFWGVGVLFGSSILQPKTVAATSMNMDEQTIKNNIDSVLLLQENYWKDLSAQERVDVLQTVANIERRYLGLPHELNVGVTNLGENTLGHYDNEKHEIIVSLDSLMNDSVEDVLSIVCHEAYHGYQWCLISVLQSTPEEAKNLRLLRDAKDYAEEFSNYKRGNHDFDEYYYQDCEIDARSYAEEAVIDYYRSIEQFFNEKNGD